MKFADLTPADEGTKIALVADNVKYLGTVATDGEEVVFLEDGAGAFTFEDTDKIEIL